MRHLVVVLGLWAAGLLSLTPPGLCACWLMFDPGVHHPHFDGHPERSHQHGYLFDLFQSQTGAVAPLALIPIAMLLALQAARCLWQRLAFAELSACGWSFAPLTPPPRFSLL